MNGLLGELAFSDMLEAQAGFRAAKAGWRSVARGDDEQAKDLWMHRYVMASVTMDDAVAAYVATRDVW